MKTTQGSKVETGKLRFDGVMRFGDKSMAQFTELDKSSPSYGASFYLPSEEATLKQIAEKRAEKRAEFSGSGRAIIRAGALALAFFALLSGAIQAQDPARLT